MFLSPGEKIFFAEQSFKIRNEQKLKKLVRHYISKGSLLRMAEIIIEEAGKDFPCVMEAMNKLKK